MSTTHTPGPWKVNKKVETSVEQSAAGQGINLICQTEDPDGIRTKEEEKANARLIAAAPELLEALNALYTSFQHTPDNQRGNKAKTDIITLNPDVKAALNKARNAIAKSKYMPV